jgi:RNA polymerase sigma-70 factor (sigma-E family)
VVTFEEFVAASSPRLVRTARMLLGNGSEAEDMAQETLIVMHRQWRRLRDPAAAEAYALRTLIRLTRRHLQRARFRHESARADVLGAGEGAIEPPREPDGDLVKALAALGSRQREAVVLRYFLDLTIEETSRLMRCSPGTVKSQTSAALAALRRHLERAERAELMGKDGHGN